jgi:mono/diheme cytochrome c family protein
MLRRSTPATLALLVGLIAAMAIAAEPDAQPLEPRFAELVQPFLKNHCLACHGADKPKGKLDLSAYSSVAAVVRDHRVWDRVLERLDAEEMPPEEAKRQPTPHERRAVIEWIGTLREREARKNAGDPGPVLARRLSNAEYDHTIRDLTGVDIQPTREFPVDPANEAGFDNSGESLTMSPALVKKLLAAARWVADHLVLKPDGIAFAPHAAVTDVDRDKYCVQRIMEFYRRHRIDYADSFLAAWRFQYRAALGKPNASLADIARDGGLSARYLATLWTILNEPWPAESPLGDVQAFWRKLPADVNRADEARVDCERMRDLVLRLRKGFELRVGKLQVHDISPGSQPLVLWRNRQLADGYMRVPKDGAPRDLQEFCRVFPATFFVADRAPYYDPKAAGSGRFLTAGFHLMQGFFRDDAPLYELALDDRERRELDTRWKELNFVTLAPMRQYKDFIFFERAEPPRFMMGAEFDFARSEDKSAISEAKIAQLRAAYLAKARKNGANDEAIKAIETYFVNISAEIRDVEQARRAAEPSHLEALKTFAARAYRRPLSQAENDDLLAFYRKLRVQDELSHEDAMRDSVTSVLMSPYFCYRLDLAEAGEAARPLSDYGLASRLSYFLWSSMPDEELLARAAAGDLHQKAVLVAQAQRMLRDEHIRGLATEFAGNWLGFRRFEEHNSVDRERFASFTNELRQAMYEEPIRFFVDVASRNRSVLDLLYADNTFVNPILAKHYGMPVPDVGPSEWVLVDDAHRYGRGGFLPMSVFLTANSPGLRTSPVKRGYWVVRRLLGERIPAPPPEVPELPKDEAKTGDLTLPQLLARHRQEKSCAGCHQRFDSIGLVFEGYGPIGERRERDLGGRPVDAQATFPDGSEGAGLDGLRRYLFEERQEDFLDNLCRKLLAFGLGRGLLPSDEAIIKKMRASLAADGYRFDCLIESIVTSPQFLNKRGKDDPRQRAQTNSTVSGTAP